MECDFFLKIYFYMHSCFASMYVFVRMPDSLKLELVMSCHVGVGNWTYVPWKSSLSALNCWAIYPDSDCVILRTESISKWKEFCCLQWMEISVGFYFPLFLQMWSNGLLELSSFPADHHFLELSDYDLPSRCLLQAWLVSFIPLLLSFGLVNRNHPIMS